ncbi:MAG: type I toxin-antitoxin system SymE family toxin [Lachnospiraceae bacterium]|nr:type I toxin-antitoxin system SymE family toxin [Lachnospiraceae bacterium]
MDKRQLKVYQGSGKDYAPVPEIKLKGKWLENIGFSIGSTIQADCKNGTIIITKQDKNKGNGE